MAAAALNGTIFLSQQLQAGIVVISQSSIASDFMESLDESRASRLASLINLSAARKKTRCSYDISVKEEGHEYEFRVQLFKEYQLSQVSDVAKLALDQAKK